MTQARQRVLMVHNAYQQRGGEDSVVESETALLRAHGHEVELYLRHNDDVDGISRASLAVQTVWSRRTEDDISALITRFRPDIVHVHNTLPLVSPSVFWTAHRMQCAVVQTLHNFRLMCPQAMFLREGKVCEDCLGHVPWRGVMRGCYRQSVVQTAALSGSIVWHRMLGTYDKTVTRFIALSEFSRRKFIEGGLPADRICVKPNFVDDVGAPDETAPRAGGLFVGRLSHEKGVEVLLQALKQPAASGARVEVIGSGDFERAMRDQLGQAFLGYLPVGDILERLRGAAYLLLPSLCYENFPRTLAEAYCSGVPVIASRLGAMAELVQDGQTGLLFTPGDAADLAAKIAWAEAHPQAMRDMGRRAREIFVARYSPEPNHRRLTEIYDQALAELRTRS
ncbi:MAG: glycosyltransferase family 4 protein [Aquabacterium sp.]